MARIRRRVRPKTYIYRMEWWFTADKKRRMHSIAVPPKSAYVVNSIGTVSMIVINQGEFTTANVKFSRHLRKSRRTKS